MEETNMEIRLEDIIEKLNEISFDLAIAMHALNIDSEI